MSRVQYVMKLVLPLHDLETTLDAGWLRPIALMPLADSNVFGQIVQCPLRVEGIVAVFPGRAGEGEAADWFRAAYPDLDAYFVAVQQAGSPLHAVWLSRSLWREGTVLLALGDSVVDADLSMLAGHEESAVWIGNGHGTNGPAGLLWFRSGETLVDLLRPHFAGSTAGRALSLAELLRLVGSDYDTAHIRPNLALSLQDDGEYTAGKLLAANSRLLGFGRVSAGAIERSYSDEFTVLPPVALSDDAVINSSVIGPQTTIAAGASVERSVIGHSIICPGARVENAVLDNALIGDNAVVSGGALSGMIAEGQGLLDGENQK